MDPKFSAILLAAGRGSRMKSRRPKVLHEILGVPMIEVITASVRDAGAADLIVVLGHGADEVRGCLGDSSIRIAIQQQQLGTADALLAALRQQPPACAQVLVVNGDLPDLDPTLLASFVADHGKSSSAFSVATARVADPTGMGRIVRDQTGDFISIVEEEQASDTERAIEEVNLGLYVLDAEVVTPVLDEMVAGDLSGKETAGESYLTRLVEVLVQRSMVVDAIGVGVDHQFLQVNDRVGLARVSRIIQDRLQQRFLEQGVTIVDPTTTWVEFGVSIGKDTVIHPQTIIRRGVRVGTCCEIGPFAHLRGGTVIGDDVKVGDFVEINRSELADGVRAKHLAYLGDTKVESGANIGAGAVVANYDGVKKFPTTIGENAFIGSGSVIVAPGNIGAGAVVAAGAVVPPGRDVHPGTTVLGVPARERKSQQDLSDDVRDDEREIR